MKKIYSVLSISLLLLVLYVIPVKAQSAIKTTPVNTAVVGSEYKYDVNVYPVGDSTFTLTASRQGMAINAETGLITWTPQSLNDGGLVVVTATVGGIASTQSYYVYVSDNSVLCDPAMISYWKLDEESGTTFADSKSGYNAITGVAPQDIQGMVGRAKYFNPYLGNKLSVSDIDDQYDWISGNDITGSVWFRSSTDITSLTGPQVFMGRLGNSGNINEDHWWWFGLDTNNYVRFEASNDAGMKTEGEEGYPNTIACHSNFGVHYEDDVWHHAAFVLEGTGNAYTVSIYVDGNLTRTASKTFLEGDFTSNADLSIGWWQNPWEVEHFNYQGSLDEVVLYKRALSGSEISGLYAKGAAGQSYCYSGNFAPLFKSQPALTVDEDATYSYNIVTDDYEDGSSLEISVVEAPEWLDGFLDNGDGTGTINGVPANDDVGNHEITLSVTDGFATVEQSFTLEVVNVNDIPQFTSTPVTTGAANAQYQYWVTVTDEDDAQTNCEATVIPDWATFSFNPATGTGLLSGTPNANSPRLNNVTLTASDSHGGNNPQQFVITLSGVISGVEDVEGNASVKVYPSPAKEFVYVETGNEFENGKIQILSMSGVVLRDVVIDERTEKIDLTGMSHGVYFYKVTGSEGEVTGKLIKD